MRYYTTINTTEFDLVNWDWFDQSRETVRYNSSNTKCIVSFDLEYCDEMQRFNGLAPKTLSEAHIMVNQPEWQHDNINE